MPASEWANHRARPGCRGRAGSERDDHGLQPQQRQQRGLRLRDGRSQQLGQPVALHGHRSVVLDARSWQARRCSAAGPRNGTSRSSANRTTTRTVRRATTCIRAGRWRRAVASAISGISTCRSSTSSSWPATTRCPGRHRLRRGAPELRRPRTGHHVAAGGEPVSRTASARRRRRSC